MGSDPRPAVADDAYDEDRDRSGALRPGYAEMLAALKAATSTA